MRHLAEGRSPEQALEEELAEIELLCEQRSYRRAQDIAQRLLRSYPTSARVHEAMGDVSAAAGHHREAVQWYELTLQLGFGQQVMDKLSEQRRLQAESEAAAAQPSTPAEPEESEPHYRLIAAIAGAVVLLVVVSLIIMAARGGKPAEPSPSPPAPRAVSTRATPQGPAAAAPSATPAPSAPGQPARRSYGQPGPTPGTPGAEAPRQELPPVHITRAIDAPLTDQDRALLAALSSLTWPNGQNLSGDVNAMVDPYTGYAFITLKLPPALKGSTQFTTGLSMAYGCAVAAIKADRSVRSLTVRMIAPVTTGDTETMLAIFRGNTNRATLERYMQASANPNTKEIWQGVFATTWWNPSVPVEMPF